MSTVYITANPMTMAEFEVEARAVGWEPGEYEGRPFWGNGTHYVHDVGETPAANGDTHIGFTCYAGNYPGELEETMVVYDEHQEEFWDIVGQQEDDEELLPPEGE